MREIKFRAWDKVNKGYFSCLSSINFDREVGITVLSTLDSMTLWGEQFILEQFTGLYDATKWEELTEDERAEWTRSGNMPSEWKGREIYEGDRMEFPGYGETVIEYRGARFCSDRFSSLEYWDEGTCDGKVIGNIHTGIIK